MLFSGVFIVCSIRTITTRTKYVVPSKIQSEECWKKPYTHHKSSIRSISEKSIALEILIWYRTWTLTCWSFWNLLILLLPIRLSYEKLPRIFSTSFSINRYKCLFRYSTFANRTKQCFFWLVDPLINARPAIEMATLWYNWFISNVETNIAFKFWSTWICLLFLLLVIWFLALFTPIIINHIFVLNYF